MREVSFAVAFGVLTIASAAGAQTAGGITNIQSSAGTTAYVGSDSSLSTFGPGAGTTPTVGSSGSTYNSYVNVGSQQIVFESENTGSGPSITTTSFSQLSFTVNNNTGAPATFASTITAAGLGFYLADTSGGCLYTGCAQIATDAGYSFADLPSNDGIGSIGFSFSVTRLGDNSSLPLYSLDGSLEIGRDGSLILFDNLTDFTDPASAAAVLNGFVEARGNDYDPQQGIGAATGITYAWDATDFSFDIGSQATQTLVYRTSVYSTSSQSCIPGTSICLVAYSGFGDPVGRGGGNDAAFASFARGVSTSSIIPDNGRINGLTYGPSTFNIPTFEDGVVTYRASGAVPEPATWISMIFGFGLLGSVLRRRRTAVAATA